MSLKDKLLGTLINNQYTSLNEIHRIAQSNNYKQSNAERQMRKIVEDTRLKPYWGRQIEPDTNDKGHIIGYHTKLK